MDGVKLSKWGLWMDINEIRIRKDGKWYADRTVEMFRRNILNILARNIERTDNGDYFIRMGEEEFPLVVEDVPFFANGIMEKERQLTLRFYDLQEMPIIQPIKLILKDDIPYISYRWPGDTKLSRGVYYKLSDYFQFEGDDVYIVPPAQEASE